MARALRERVRQMRRDVRALAAGLMGRHRPPLVARGPRRAATPSASARAARRLQVVDRTMETADAVSLVLADPSGAPIEFVPGQFFTLLVEVGGRELRRAYSASSDHRDAGRVRLTIKRVGGGAVSGQLIDGVGVGDELRLLGPSGSFTCTPERDAARHLVLIAGGSGITPLYSIALAIAEGEPGSRVTVLYGNRGVEDVIFLADLEELQARHGDRVVVRHVLEQPPDDWDGGTGRLDAGTVASELDRVAADDRPVGYWVCGPEPMMVAVREALAARGVPAGDIREERFTGPQRRATRAPASAIGAVHGARITRGGATREVPVEPGQTLLDAGLAAGVPMEFSCAMGGCGACRVKLTDGEVDSDEPNCLTPSERADGYVLACVSRLCTDVTVEAD